MTATITTLADQQWRLLLTKTPKGVVKATAGNALLFVQHRFDLQGFAFDELAQRSVVQRRQPWIQRAREFPSNVTDDDALFVAAWLEQREGVAFSPPMIANAIEAASRDNSFNPVIEWIDHIEWDGCPRLSTWAIDILGCDDSPYARDVGRAWIISALARAYYPGCQADSMIVLEGSQGCGKTTVLSVLAGKWFKNDPFDLSGDIKRTQELLRGTWIYEIAELAGLSKADSARTKAFVSLRSDSYRPAYGRQTIDVPRRLVFAGSTNPDGTGYLKDPTGGRRYWPLACGRRVDTDRAARDRDQIFAEALSALRSGDAWHLVDADSERSAAAVQADRLEADPWMAELADWADGRYSATTRDVLDQIGVAPKDRTRTHEMRAAAILSAMGFNCSHGRTDRKRYRSPCGICGS